MAQHLLITGASGLIGKKLVAHYLAKDWKITTLSTSGSNPFKNDNVNVVKWDPKQLLETGDYRGLQIPNSPFDLVINLAGSSIGEGRFTKERKKKITKSRSNSGLCLVAICKHFDIRPKTWIQASGIGYYGDTGETDIDENVENGKLFLSDVCEKWEAPIISARDIDTFNKTRFVIARIGVVIAPEATAWKKLIQPIKMGVGGKLGSGKQWWTWIHINDVVRAFDFMYQKELNGVFNVVSPEPLRQFNFYKKIANKLKRPCILPTPAFILRLVLGEMADELLLPSCKAQPKRLYQEEFKFEYSALDTVLKKYYS